MDEAVLKRMVENLPDGAKISIGGQRSFGRPGMTPIFVNPTADYSNKSSGSSITVGVGKIGGCFINLANFDGKHEVSVGTFPRTPTGASFQSSINVTDL
uniref:hypothetical protein n=1 Tax=Methylobacterium sp. B34 TaxID=95563 RepID=UPI000FE148E2|nr:hypothetical protein [Methylobacterium sp. B34]